MVETYLPILLMIIIAIALGISLFVLSYIFGYVRKSRTSKETYECGMALLDEAEKRISIRYYVVLLLFLLFDVETLLLFPIIAVYREILKSGYKFYSFLEIVVFIGILFVGYVYIYKKDALKWE